MKREMPDQWMDEEGDARGMDGLRERERERLAQSFSFKLYRLSDPSGTWFVSFRSPNCLNQLHCHGGGKNIFTTLNIKHRLL